VYFFHFFFFLSVLVLSPFWNTIFAAGWQASSRSFVFAATKPVVVRRSGKSSIGIPLEIAASTASRGFGGAAVDGNVFGEL